jgi:L-serine dehydratase
MEHGHVATLGEFFVLYEATNQQLPRSAVIGHMECVLAAMRESVSQGLAGINTTYLGMIDGGAARINRFLTGGGSLLGTAFSTVVRNTLAVAENNACMGRVVAAPTAEVFGKNAELDQDS